MGNKTKSYFPNRMGSINGLCAYICEECGQPIAGNKIYWINKKWLCKYCRDAKKKNIVKFPMKNKG